jgi:thiol-disulfide isomerase/thioredoxin
MKRLLMIMFLISSLVLSSCGRKPEASAPKDNSQQEAATGEEEEVKMEAPDFEITSLGGKKVKLSNLKGKVVVMNFFATWCPPCRAEFPDFMKVVEEYKGKDVEFLFIDVQEDKKTVEEFLRSGNYNIDPLMDSKSKVFSALYGLRGLPTTFIVDRDGYLIDGISGQTNRAVLKAAIEKGLEK